LLEDAGTLAPGAELTLEVNEPSVLRRLAVSSATLGALSASLEIDGTTVIDAPVESWMFSAPPSEPFDSALAINAADRVELLYPAPVRTGAVLRVRNTSAGPVDVGLALEHDPGAPADDLGALRIVCGAPMIEEIGPNIRLVDVDGVRGHYAGQSLVTHGATAGFTVLEGDHELFGGPFALPFTGASGATRLPSGGTIAFQYRHHLIDTVPFTTSFAFEYETFNVNSTFEHCSYWYEH
jgi:hypothetical protein